ncbi:MAG TPA: RHS repeat-associated core domain-containing protein [Capsulimonadaceae bacterium]|nr:RHS repeat-associated core domain-containing protein [Capsulimonadaceae bacterium]
MGYPYQVSDSGSSQVFWTATSRDAELHLVSQTAGNGVVTSQSFDATTGRILSIMAGTSNSVADQTYNFDTLGNLQSRSWLTDNTGDTTTENSCYDNLNRLQYSNVGGACSATGRMRMYYDALGNITRKSDVCSTNNCMAYGGSAGPHAVTSITGTYLSVTNPVFQYDGNGNLTCISSGAGCTGTIGRSATWTSFNMAASVTEGTNTAALTYDSEHARVKQVTTGTAAGTTYYLNDPVTGTLEEELLSGSTTTWHDYIMADGRMVAERFCTGAAPCTGTPTLEYFVPDHLGSISVITDASGNVLERLSYDAWGRRRNIDGSAAACGTITSSTTRGFTGQEMMDGVCLVNLNARLYDPALGRFLSPDPVAGTVYDLQELNRYTYVLDNPLSLTDPTGLCHGFWACLGDVALDILFPIRALAPLIRQFPILGDIIVIGEGIACGPLCAAAAAAEVTGFTTGNVGEAFKAFAITLAEAEAFQEISSLHLNSSNSFIGVVESAGLHGFVGGLTSLAEGGRFQSGFIAAAFSDLAAPNPNTGGLEFGTIEAAVAGGVGSLLGGGKFANGAVTGAFAYIASSVGQGEEVVETGSSGAGTTTLPAGANSVSPQWDMSNPYVTEQEAATAAANAVNAAEQATNHQWEFGAFWGKIGDSYYSTFAETSHYQTGVFWKIDSLANFFANYDVLGYTHYHVVQALAWSFSDADKATAANWAGQESSFHGFFLQYQYGAYRWINGGSVKCGAVLLSCGQ